MADSRSQETPDILLIASASAGKSSSRHVSIDLNPKGRLTLSWLLSLKCRCGQLTVNVTVILERTEAGDAGAQVPVQQGKFLDNKFFAKISDVFSFATWKTTENPHKARLPWKPAGSKQTTGHASTCRVGPKHFTCPEILLAQKSRRIPTNTNLQQWLCDRSYAFFLFSWPQRRSHWKVTNKKPCLLVTWHPPTEMTASGVNAGRGFKIFLLFCFCGFSHFQKGTILKSVRKNCTLGRVRGSSQL